MTESITDHNHVSAGGSHFAALTFRQVRAQLASSADSPHQESEGIVRCICLQWFPDCAATFLDLHTHFSRTVDVMLRRVISLTAGAILGGAVAVATAMPAQAAEVDLSFGPLSIGDYCHANVSSSAFIGFYESGGLRCYAGGMGGGLQYTGSGSPYLACKYLTTDVVMSALRGASDSLVCRVIR
jgi:hypothetical protein